MRWNFIVAGFIVLLFESFLDNVRGPLIPVLNRALSLNYAQTSWFLTAGNLASIGCTFLMILLARRFAEREMTIGICVIGLIGTTLSLWVTGFSSLVLLGIILGSTIAMMGGMGNLLVFKGTDLVHRSRYLCGLHMMYGFGSFLCPALAGAFLNRGMPWYSVLLFASVLFVLLIGFIALRFPKQDRVDFAAEAGESLSFEHVFMIVTFAVYVAGEVGVSMWMTTYLVETRHFTVEASAPYLGGFFLVMGFTRLACFLSLRPMVESFLLWGGLVGCLVFFGLGYWGGMLWAFPFAGCLGPFFPLFMARLSRTYPKQAATLSLWVITSMQITLATLNWVFGRMADRWGTEKAYVLPFLLIGTALLLLLAYFRIEKRVFLREEPV